MSWSERYLQKKFPEHMRVGEVPKVSKAPLGTLGTALPLGSAQKKYAPLGDAPCPACGCGSFWRGKSGAWHCESCDPPGAEHVTTWRNIGGGKVPQAPRPAEAWPADLDAMLRRVSAFYEWTQADRADFIAWAQRSAEGLSDARVFLEHEVAKLPMPGLSDRRRVVVGMLKDDPALRVAWTCEDRGEDPVRLVIAIRGAGVCEMGIPRERFNAMELPMLIEELMSA